MTATSFERALGPRTHFNGLLAIAMVALGACDSASVGSGQDSDASSNQDTSAAGRVCGLLGVPCPEGFACVKQRAALLDNGITEWCYSESEGAVYVPGGTLPHACSRPKLPKCAPTDADAWAFSFVFSLPPYAILQLPATMASYEACIADAACDPITGAGAQSVRRQGYPEFPLIPAWQTRWQQAVNYCDWWGAKTGQPWRLCSVAEWDLAMLGGCETLTAQMSEKGLGCPEAMRLYPWGDEPPFCEIQFDADDCLRKIPGWRPDPLGFRPGSASAYGAMEATGTPPQWMADCINDKVPPTDGSPRSGDCHLNESRNDVLRVLRGHALYANEAFFGATGDPRATVGAIICCRDMPQASGSPTP